MYRLGDYIIMGTILYILGIKVTDKNNNNNQSIHNKYIMEFKCIVNWLSIESMSSQMDEIKKLLLKINRNSDISESKLSRIYMKINEIAREYYYE